MKSTAADLRFNRLLILPFHERWAARQRIRQGQPLFGGGFSVTGPDDAEGWQAKPVPAESNAAAAFKLLGLSELAATADDVKRAFKAQALLHHPDRGGDVKKFHAASAARDYCLAVLKGSPT
jgi:hypothetical protein